MAGEIDRARAAARMMAAGMDALLVLAPETFLWATGAPAGVAANWRRLGAAMALVPADPARPVGAVVTDLFAGAAEAAGLSPLHVHAIWPEAMDLRAPLAAGLSLEAAVAAAAASRPADFARPATFDRDAALAALGRLARQMGLEGKRIGMEMGALPAADAPALQAALPAASLTDATGLIERLRAVKSAAEIARLRTAAELTEAALRATIPAIRLGATRAAIVRAFQDAVQAAAAAAGVAGVTSWEYAGFGAAPWASPGGVAIGDVVKLDVGAVVGGYSADLARCFTLGPATPAARRVHESLAAGFAAGRAALVPGAPLAGVHAAAIGAVRACGFPAYARGHVGHGLGASIWSEEWPYLAADSDALAEPGMVLAFELPWYLDGLGGFIIEDMLLVTTTGVETLAGANLPRELVELQP